MVDDPAEYRWSSYAGNALGGHDPVIKLHPVMESLDCDPRARRAAYRELFREALAPQLVEQIRASTNGGFALGSERFQKQMADLLRRRVTPLGRGGARPRRPKESVPFEAADSKESVPFERD
jgi:putative transposase